MKSAYVLKGKGILRVELKEGADVFKFKEEFNREYSGLEQVNREGLVADFTYQENRIKDIKVAALDQAERVIRSRVDKWGVAEPIISRTTKNSIMVQLPGFKDPEKAKDLLGRTAQLKFKIVDEEFKGLDSIDKKQLGNVVMEKQGKETVLISEDRNAILELTKGLIPADRELYFGVESIAGGKKSRYKTHILNAATELTGDDVFDAYVSQDSSGVDPRPVVSLQLTGPGGKRFEDVTGANVGKKLAIVLDDVVESDPVIQARIAGGRAQITLGRGNYNEIVESAQSLSLILKSGALPATIKVLEERQVGASLGPELASQGILSTVVGLILVFGFMLAYYKRPGLVAWFALALNGVFLLVLMSSFGFSLSLPGIAGFILTLGMAVDANVLINERIRQELREGKAARKALENGFKKVLWTIVDSNATSLIAALVLLQTNSSGPIKGFAVTLLLGLLVSLFTSLYCSQLVFEFILSRCKTERGMRLWLGASSDSMQVGDDSASKKGTTINFLGMAPIAIAISIAIGLGSILVGGVKGLNWAVDFAGGTEIEVAFSKDVSSKELEQVASKAGINDIVLQALGTEKKQYLIRFDKDKPSEGNQKVEEMDIRGKSFQQYITSELAKYQPDIKRIDYVGPQVGKELRTQGALSLLYALLGILLYIALRFDFRFAPGSAIKMIVDLLVVMGFYAYFRRSFDLTSVAALLTVAGYTVNDTVVIYDRIRERLTLFPALKLRENVNTAVNETLSRSINTSICTLLSLIGIIVFGTASIWNFAAAMAVGVFAATYSSTFLATSSVLWFEQIFKKRAARNVNEAVRNGVDKP